MNQKERLNLIIAELENKHALSLKEIIQLTNTSRDTARRDIVKLAESRLVERTYGSVSLPNHFAKLDEYEERQLDEYSQKEKIAEKAAELIHDNTILFLDISTTVSFLPLFLSKKKGLSVYTNSLDIASLLLKKCDHPAHMLGGMLSREKRCVTGTKPFFELDHYQFHTIFISAAGLNEHGIFYAHEEDIEVKNKLRQKTQQLIVLLDHTKIGLKHNYRAFSLDKIDILITDKPLDPRLASALQDADVTLIYSEEE